MPHSPGIGKQSRINLGNLYQGGLKMGKRGLSIALAVVGFFWGAGYVGAQALNYPTKPIICQVPWPAGGSTDLGARIVTAIAEKKMGQPIVVTNKVGAGSQIGLTETARA
jgi:tripartite-type tricarboxylate transporter receptor subunit TctC